VTDLKMHGENLKLFKQLFTYSRTVLVMQVLETQCTPVLYHFIFHTFK